MAADPKRSGRPAGEGSDLMGVGVQFTVTFLAFLFAGRWLDARLGTAPWLLLAGLFLGFILGVLWLYRKLVWDPRSPDHKP